ncbi:MAG: histidinol-phosphate transaminase [Elusimicrobiota bacterium]|jgi:histidinol-phosphate aminotransferase|nr:histidinol-phosphate transaminase [Elusimicrobiota bacterium]
MDITKLIRENCKGFEPYVAGKPIETIKRELKLKSVIKLASNENNLGPSKKAIAAIKKNINNVYFYPDSNSFELKKALSKKYKLPVENLFTGAGGDEIIEILAKLFFTPEDEIVISKHSFVRYGMAVQMMNSKAVIVPMREGLVQDLNAMLDACTENTKAIFITNPNNPTGTYNNKTNLENFLSKVKINKFGEKPLIILDEAYFEYGKLQKDFPDGLDYLKDNENLIIFRTFSKVYGLAGLRVGYGFAHADIVDYIERTRPPFNVNALAQAAAAASLSDSGQVKKGQTLIKAEKKYLYSEFNKLGIKFIETAANFILINVAPFIGQEIFSQLLKKGVIVRAMGEYDLSDWVRITIGLHKENEIFIKKLKEVLNK